VYVEEVIVMLTDILGHLSSSNDLEKIIPLPESMIHITMSEDEI
jgi:hypothetical protein